MLTLQTLGDAASTTLSSAFLTLLALLTRFHSAFRGQARGECLCYLVSTGAVLSLWHDLHGKSCVPVSSAAPFFPSSLYTSLPCDVCFQVLDCCFKKRLLLGCCSAFPLKTWKGCVDDGRIRVAAGVPTPPSLSLRSCVLLGSLFTH